MNVAELLSMVVPAFNDIHRDNTPEVKLAVAPPSQAKNGYFVLGHDSRLGQVVNNILDNAISFSPEDSDIQLQLRRVGREIEISIEDEGPGIPEDHLDKIFERFYTDRPEDEYGNNSGLGLNISRQIVAAHGGRIWAENRQDGTLLAGGTIKENRAKAGENNPHTLSDTADDGKGTRRRIRGARFIIRLPAVDGHV